MNHLTLILHLRVSAAMDGRCHWFLAQPYPLGPDIAEDAQDILDDGFCDMQIGG